MTRGSRLRWRAAVLALALGAGTAQARAQPAGWVDARLLADILAPALPPAAPRQAAWRQRLLQAEAAGDAIASWVLRHCRSAPALDRSGLDSSCSPEPAAQERARQRLLALGLGPSFDRAVSGDPARGIPSREVCAGTAGQACPAEATARWLADRLAEVERDGVVQGLAHVALPLCPQPAARAAPSVAEVDCARLRHHLQAVRTLARQHLKPDWQPADSELQRALQHPYARMDDTSFPPQRHQPGDAAWRPQDEATERFYEAVLRSLHTMAQNLRLKLLHEPRWAVFIGHTPAALERQLAQRAELAAPPPPAGAAPRPLFLQHRQHMQRFVGSYAGAVFGSSRQPVLTWLHPSGSGVMGGYAFIRQPGSALQLNLGRLGPCLAGGRDEMVCVWQDRHGSGLVSMLFDAAATAFRARWEPLPRSGQSDFLRMDPRHWDEPSSWNGVLR